MDEIFLNAIDAMRQAGHLLPGERAVLGVSGGADSLVLLHLFHRHARRLEIEPLVVHINHGLRGSAAAADAAFVAATCAEWDIGYRVQTMDVPTLVEEYGYTLEEAARRARYTVLAQTAIGWGSSAVVVAHQADDQAETVLLNLVRGAGLHGLRGMQAVTPIGESHLLHTRVQGDADALPVVILRPLLAAPRAEILAYCELHGLEPREDATNKDPAFTRNRIRHVVMPFLETINPNLTATLNRTADLITEEAALLDRRVDDAWAQIMQSEAADHIALSRAGWGDLPVALQRATLRRAVQQVAPGAEPGFVHIEEARRIIREGETNAKVDLPGGVRLTVEHTVITLHRREEKPLPTGIPMLGPHDVVHIAVPCDVRLPGTRWRFSLQPYDGPRSGERWQALLAEPWATPLDGAALRAPLMLRTREPGDRFRPQGVGGTQKVSDFLSNNKVSLSLRDRLPLLVSVGRILWVCGYRVDERAIVAPKSESVWVARFTPVEAQ